jgi:tetratricopeptide (TPR) repeat protein
MDLHNWMQAEPPLRQAIAVNERLGAAYLALGSCLLEEEKFDEAEQQLVKGLELTPEAAHGHYDLSRTYYALGRFDEARLRALKAVEIGRPQADVHFLLGEILLRLGENYGALSEFEECLRLAPGAPLEALAQQKIDQLQSQQVSVRPLAAFRPS